MVLSNYVKLVPNKPSRLHFADYSIVTDTIIDPLTRKPKLVSKLTFIVDELDGQKVASSYSILSEKQAMDIAPYLPNDRYKNYDFIITVSGSGHLTEYTIQPQLRAAT